MWLIIKHTFEYYRYLFGAYFFIILGAFFYDSFISNNSNSFMAPIMTNIMIFIMFSTLSREKWERLHTRLPIKPGTLALSRLYVILIPSIGIYFFNLSLIALFYPTKNVDYWQLIFVFGIFVSFYFLALIGRDIYCSVNSIFKFCLYCVGMLITLALFGFGFFGLFSIFHLFPSFEKMTPTLAEFLFFMSLFILIILGSLTIFSFKRRKSYL